MSKLTEEDYDFSNVPDYELASCVYYEYMRESKAIIREVKKTRTMFLREAKRRNTENGDSFSLNVTLTKVTEHQGMFEFALVSILAGRCPEFLAVPWQKLSDSAKDRLRDFIVKATELHNSNFRKEHPPLVMDTLSKTPALGRTTLDDWKLRTMPKRYQKLPAPDRDELLFYGFFQINTIYTADRLIDAFRDWLNVNHPKCSEKTKGRRGRDSKRDSLNALGALRLRYYCKTFTEAKQRMDRPTEKSKKMFYGDRSSFNRACEAAVRHFHFLLQLSDSHLPIHFTKGWQK